MERLQLVSQTKNRSVFCNNEIELHLVNAGQGYFAILQKSYGIDAKAKFLMRSQDESRLKKLFGLP